MMENRGMPCERNHARYIERCTQNFETHVTELVEIHERLSHREISQSQCLIWSVPPLWIHKGDVDLVTEIKILETKLHYRNGDP